MRNTVSYIASPARRPPPAVRALAAVAGVAALLFNAMLMLSDRAPGVLHRFGGGVVRRLFERIDAGERAVDVLTDPRSSDTAVHFAVWALAVILVGWAVWTWIGLLIGAVAVFGASVVVEGLQSRLSTSRSVEAADVRANLAGSRSASPSSPPATSPTARCPRW